MKKLLVIALFFPLFSFGQDKGEFSMEFSVEKNSFVMERLNNYFTDTNLIQLSLFEEVPNSKIENGQNFSYSFSYQPINFMDFGFYGTYQYGKMERNPRVIVYNPESGMNDTFPGLHKFKASAFCFGFASTLYVNKLLKLDEKKSPLNRLILGVNINAGLGYSTMSNVQIFENIEDPESKGIDYKSTDFQGKLGLKLGYIVFKKPINCSIGANFGYQYYRTSTIKSYIGKELPKSENQKPVNLDFSGIFGGVFLRIGL